MAQLTEEQADKLVDAAAELTLAGAARTVGDAIDALVTALFPDITWEERSALLRELFEIFNLKRFEWPLYSWQW